MVPAAPELRAQALRATRAAIAQLAGTYRGIGVEERGAEIHITVPPALRDGHEAHFAQVAANCLGYSAVATNRDKTVLLPNQLAADGSFPEELRRTKPYGYSLFNLDAMTAVCQIASSETDNLWRYELPDGRGIRKAVSFLFPFIANKQSWPRTRPT